MYTFLKFYFIFILLPITMHADREYQGTWAMVGADMVEIRDGPQAKNEPFLSFIKVNNEKRLVPTSFTFY